ncbi:MAG: hypothetical protein ACRC6M_06690 [Microcystaceae cyanobacterium]
MFNPKFAQVAALSLAIAFHSHIQNCDRLSFSYSKLRLPFIPNFKTAIAFNCILR